MLTPGLSEPGSNGYKTWFHTSERSRTRTLQPVAA